ncbi:MAG: hypothetical protein J7M19_05395 [Planctomycetes bacterium]|nr:hypothetical protein [Planctomycetota bacterium]
MEVGAGGSDCIGDEQHDIHQEGRGGRKNRSFPSPREDRHDGKDCQRRKRLIIKVMGE